MPLLISWASKCIIMSDSFILEPFGLECICEYPACKQMFDRYQAIYEKYVHAVEESKNTAAQNKALGFDVNYKITALELQIKQLHQIYQREVAVVNAFQGNLEQDRPLLQDKTVCPNCIGHRNALMVQRKFISNEYDKVRANHDQINETIEKCKADVMAERMENGKLRAKYWRHDDPFWRNKEIQMLRAERDQAMGEAAELKNTIALLKQEKEQNRQRYITATGIIESLQSELCDVRTERDILKGRKLTLDQENELSSQMRFDAAVNQFRQKAEGRGVKREYEETL